MVSVCVCVNTCQELLKCLDLLVNLKMSESLSVRHKISKQLVFIVRNI